MRAICHHGPHTSLLRAHPQVGLVEAPDDVAGPVAAVSIAFRILDSFAVTSLVTAIWYPDTVKFKGVFSCWLECVPGVVYLLGGAAAIKQALTHLAAVKSYPQESLSCWHERGSPSLMYGSSETEESASMLTAIQPTGLMVDLLTAPETTTLTNPNPTFSWIVNDTEPNAFQEAFQILVSSSAERLANDEGDVWDSGEPDPGAVWKSEQGSTNVPYDGPELASDTQYHWKVRTWNGVGNVSPWSASSSFRTGTLSDTYGTDSLPLAVTRVDPVTVVRTDSDRWFIDFDRAAFGTVELDLDSSTSGTIEVVLGEVPEGRYGINANPGGSRRYQKISVEIEAGKKTYLVTIPSDPRNTGDFAILMPEDVFEVYPFRYCEVIGYEGDLTGDQIRQLVVHYPFDDSAASFTSSSKVLNDVWDLCHYTMKATSFTGYYIDGDRERIPYEADAYINQLGHYCCDREYAMGRQTHEYLITTPTWPTEWILDSVLIAWNDYVYTGNKASIDHYYEDLKAKSLMAIGREDGLITLDLMTDEVLEAIHFAGKSAAQFKSGIRDIVDWPQVERDGHDMLPVNAVVNAFHYRAVTLMAQIAEALKHTKDVYAFRERAKLIRRTFVDQMIDPVTGLVLDGEGSAHSSLHANMTSLVFGLVPEENREAVVAFLKSKGMACSVYASQFLMEALYAGGEDDYALSLLTSLAERSWAHMVYDVRTTIALEAWDDRFKPNQDWNHAWGAAPASIIPRHLMGVRPLKPGFEEILIQPQPGSLEWAELTTPTIRGPVTVRFNHVPLQTFHLEIEAPANTTSTVTLPAMGSDDPVVVVDGKRILGRIDGEAVTLTGIGSGLHVFDRAV
ncbi:MAG: alpha-L-rhamnosidase [Gemmatimonadetes bacterium]|nr:alpha-L-rhamnosidase [Gemmatimonadota bacterium]